MYYLFYGLITVIILQIIYTVYCTIDINISEFEYLAAHMDPFECRRLIAALHYTSYELPKIMSGAIRKVDESISCLGHLLHWNNSPAEGKGQTHEDLQRRLRQINRNDLANWLGKTVFKQLSEDLNNAIDKPFGDLGQQSIDIQYPTIIESIDESKEESPWQLIDGLLLIIIIILLICLLIIITAIVIHKIIMYKWINNNSIEECNTNKNIVNSHSEEKNYLLYSG